MSSPVPPPANRLILPIQYLRGIAALMVVWFHGVNQVPGVADFFVGGFANSGVDLFFVISGFIMVSTTMDKAPTPMDFMRRRIVRVVPLYWLLTLVMVGTALCMPSLFRTLIVEPRTLVESLLFIPHFSSSFPDRVWPLLVPGWSLNFEMFFYVIFACSLALPRRWRLPALSATFIGLVAIGLFCGPFTSAAAWVYLNPLLIEFLAGAIIGAWCHRRGAMLPAGVAVALLIVGFAGLAFRDTPPLGMLNEMLGATLVVFAALHPLFARWRNAPLLALGDASYSLYLTHLFTLGALRLLWERLLPPIESAAAAGSFMIVALLACSGVAWLVYRLVEIPMLRGINGRGARGRSAPTSVPTN